VKPSHLSQEEIVKRDMNLALAILKTLEENKAPHLSEFDIEAALKAAFDVPNRGIGYHLNLMADANFVRSMGNDWRLTWAGHDFLKTAVPNAFETP
jgi:repressor of nif and glnA expression